jgi:hypothetical protein
MIEIRRPIAAPDVLLTKGRQLRDEHIMQHKRGDADFAFDRDVYSNTTVKASLRIAQHDKCSFCEPKVTHIAFGDIEHFRPKAAFRIRQPISARPGGDASSFARRGCRCRTPLWFPRRIARGPVATVPVRRASLLEEVAAPTWRAPRTDTHPAWPRMRAGTGTVRYGSVFVARDRATSDPGVSSQERSQLLTPPTPVRDAHIRSRHPIFRRSQATT